MSETNNKAVIKFDPSSINSKNNLITGIIFIKVNDFEFPDAKWDDFIITILVWWTNEIIGLYKKTKKIAICRFMDGPLKFNLEDLDEVYLLNLFQANEVDPFFSTKINKVIFINSLETTIKNVLDLCKKKELFNKDVLDLEKNFKELLKYLT